MTTIPYSAVFKDDSCEIYMSVDGTLHLKVITEYVRWSEWKIIGKYRFSTHTVERRKGQYQIFQRAKAIAYPYVLIKKLTEKREEPLCLELERHGKAYVKDLKKYKIVWFKDKGFERQILIPLEEFR
jgi:hypothetical protein